MYNFTPQCIFSAYKNLNGLDDKIGGLICILSVLEENTTKVVPKNAPRQLTGDCKIILKKP